MRTSRLVVLVALLALTAIICFSCSAGGSETTGVAQPAAAPAPATGDSSSTDGPVLDETYKESAVVTRVGLEGGFWGLVTVPDGRKLDPLELPPEFRKDRLRVSIWYIPRKDLQSFHMWGQVIDLRRIERRE